MRMRVVALPPQTAGPYSMPRYLLVFDRCTDEQHEYVVAACADGRRGGAEAVLVFDDEIELDAVELDESQLRQLQDAIGPK